MARIDALLKAQLENNASDLHLSVGTPPVFRIHGDLVPLKSRELSANDAQVLLHEILNDVQKEKLQNEWEIDLAYEIEGGRFRVNIFTERKGLGAAFRMIPVKIATVEELGLPQALKKMAELSKGLVLVTGATGSGKSTTLAALIDYINNSRNEHIITVEDPIEFVHGNKKSLIHQREVGQHTHSFAAALRSALREDPDIILVGEMRDLETIELAITAAETGHLVFGTLHTSSASRTIDRIINVFPTSQQDQIRMMLSESLKGVVSQNLCRKVDGKGRVAALEIMMGTHALSNLIREGKTYQILSLIQTGKKEGMQTMDQALMDLLMSKKITAAEAFSYAVEKKTFESYQQGSRPAGAPPGPPPA
ncbi:MAG: type IV pilus twitching motility protein PilT [Proteobacteria bacterium]|nr:type IV pilus twitching motility protein PilT [Pseudomonadota bacterium]